MGIKIPKHRMCTFCKQNIIIGHVIMIVRDGDAHYAFHRHCADEILRTFIRNLKLKQV